MSEHGYHITSIEKGILGESSKIVEEFNEWKDAVTQECKVMELVELSDLIGAIEFYTKSKYNISLSDLIKMSEITQRAFMNERRS